MMLNNVDLPQPDGPITARNSPGVTLNETSSSAVTHAVVRVEALDDVVDDEQRGRLPLAAAAARCDRSVAATAIGALVAGARHRRGHDRGVARLDAHIDDGDAAGIDFGDRLLAAPPARSPALVIGPKPMAPWARPMAARSISGSDMRWPIHLFSTGRLRARAIRS